jgi:hypothetical protein
LRVEVLSRQPDVITEDSAVHVLEVEDVGPRSKRETIFPLPTVLPMLVHGEHVRQSPDLLRRFVRGAIAHLVMN